MTMWTALMFGYVSAGVAMLGLQGAYTWATRNGHMISDDPHRSVGLAKLVRDVVLNMVVSITFIMAVCFGLTEWIVYTQETPIWVKVFEALAAIFIYDFAYYFVHRYWFHEWKFLRGVHAVHHAARNPRVFDSLLLHPTETLIGLGLMFGALAAVGGVHIHTFAVVFCAYSTLNVLNHAGVNIPRFPFKTLGVLADKHDRHHHSMLSGNYASITPFPDMLFGTVA